MATKYVITFSNCTENGVEAPEKIYNQTVLGFVTDVLANAAKNGGYNLDNCNMKYYKAINGCRFA